jgi:hypothetical protein
MLHFRNHPLEAEISWIDYGPCIVKPNESFKVLLAITFKPTINPVSNSCLGAGLSINLSEATQDDTVVDFDTSDPSALFLSSYNPNRPAQDGCFLCGRITVDADIVPSQGSCTVQTFRFGSEMCITTPGFYMLNFGASLEDAFNIISCQRTIRVQFDAPGRANSPG